MEWPTLGSRTAKEQNRAEQLSAVVELTALQINTFMVFAIIGCVFAAIQVIVAASGAANIDSRYNFDDCTGTVCNDVSSFRFSSSSSSSNFL